ncbi:MAG: ribonuclease HII, partial [Patescibacteria group bacterium]|nr:ribonuclease HII [Patescibacteria group bacterium]
MNKNVRPQRKAELQLRARGSRWVAGTDEAGRGAWAGPIVAAAVILPRRCMVRGIRDSKMLTPRRRTELYEEIVSVAVSYSVVVISRIVIDRRGIQYANMAALRGSILKLTVRPDAALVDAFRIQCGSTPTHAIIRGDAKELCIAAASIISKVSRGRLMDALHTRYPQYQFDRNKGYGTAQHRRSIERHGVCREHRTS